MILKTDLQKQINLELTVYGILLSKIRITG